MQIVVSPKTSMIGLEGGVLNTTPKLSDHLEMQPVILLCLTLKYPGAVTIIMDVVSPVFHSGLIAPPV